MQRRNFLKSALAASAATVTSTIEAQASPTREYFQLRKYELRSGPQVKQADAFFSGALIPALGRLGFGPIGAFRVEFGPRTPTYYLVIPGTKLENVVEADLLLAEDKEFLKAAEPFWTAPAKEPPFVRVESTLLKAFAGYPKVTVPKLADRSKGVYQLRTYESPSPADHVRKVEMFHQGEFEIFRKAGCESVFYGDALVGPDLPKLTYMLAFPDMATLATGWEKFFSAPDWKKLAADQRYAFEPIVSNVDNLILRPLPYSQV